MKVLACPLIIYICDMIFNDINYASVYQAVITGLVVAIIGHMSEVFMLKKGTLWINTFADLILSFIIVYLSQFFLIGSYITIVGAAITALLIAVAEHFEHIYLIKEGKTRKS
ncbi:hypothetical protein HMPREF1982_04310 [Clostridiales bacterium oral taxon 876 str. F0540]|nr:hypothetical protein HMPREF1982_04310 [Clostridiales bacterium oral taxon 876 str. F0540]